MRHLQTIAVAAVLLLATPGCDSPTENDDPPVEASQAQDEHAADEPDDDRADERAKMVDEQIAARGVEDPQVLDAIRAVPRHAYVPADYQPMAYRDSPLPIGHDQTISQPYIVALMTELLDVDADHRVLEIGTGSGYQAAVLAELGAEVYSIEIICELAERADADLDATGYGDVEVKCGDGYQGWPDHAPFDRIIVTAAPPEIPDALVEQMHVGARMVVPVGEGHQTLRVVEKTGDDDIETTDVAGVRFVPMVPE